MTDIELPRKSWVTHPDALHRTEDDNGDPIPEGFLHGADGNRGHIYYDPADLSTGSHNNAWDIPTQAARAGRFMQPDGTFRDPLVTGTGVLSVGSTVTITDDSKYNAWPTICWMQDGHLLLVYTKGDSHHADNTGKAVCRVGTLALDGTISWGPEVTIYDHPSLWTSAQGVASISTGRVFVSVWYDNYSASPTGVAGVVYSDDFGATWSSFITLTSTFTQDSYTAGPVVELQNGDLLIPIEGTASGSIANRSSHLLRSTDQGLTWGSEATISNYATASEPRYETNLLLLEDLSLLAIHRTSGGTGTHKTQTSTDGGATWSAVSSAFSGYGAPGVIQASTRSVIVITRKNSDASVIAFVSRDKGATWDSGTSIATGMTEMEYGKALELPDGRLFVVYGSQPSGSTSNADIKGTFVTEGTTSAAGSSLTIKEEGSSLTTAATSIDFVGAGITASGTTAAKTVTLAVALDDLTDATVTSPATGDRLRFDGTVWRTSALIWRPMTTYDPTSGLWVPLVDGSGNAIMAEA